MANGRNPKRRGRDETRDSGGFVALPWSVLDCPAYAQLSHPARSLLLEFARQYVRDNNGRLLASYAYLLPRGWCSKDVITRAKRELIAAGFVHETVMGHRPNKAAWYAVTWRTLDKIPGYDFGAAEAFQRGAYRQGVPIARAAAGPAGGMGRAPLGPYHGQDKNTTLSPSHGPRGSITGPSDGLEGATIGPGDGPIEATFCTFLSPSDGHHLDNHLLHVELEVPASKVTGTANVGIPITARQRDNAAGVSRPDDASRAGAACASMSI